MNGVTGRMGMNQHLIRSICAIRAEGGVKLKNGDRVMPDPILIGRNAEKIEALAKAHGIARWGTRLDEALADAEQRIHEFETKIESEVSTKLEELARAIRATQN